MPPRPLRVISWNVNGLRACERKGFSRWLGRSGADIVGLQEVRALSRASGGVERTELATIWDDQIPGGELDLRPHLLAAFLIVFLFEALMTRIGWQLPSFELPQRAEILSVGRSQTAVDVEPATPEPPEPEMAVAPPAAAHERRKRFDRAKRGR